MTPVITRRSSGGADFASPSIAELHDDNPYAQVAREHWLQPSAKAVKVKPDVIKSQIWDSLEKEDFRYGSLLLLESLQVLENYLWPGYTDTATNHHIILLAFIVSVKRRERLDTWSHFESDPSRFASFFRRVLSLTLDATLAPKIRTHLLAFIIGAFQSSEIGIVRKEISPLVNIHIWHNLHSDSARESRLREDPSWRKQWRTTAKRYDAADADTQGRIRFQRQWLYTLILDFFSRLYGTGRQALEEYLPYCERFLELLIDLQSQPATRRYFNAVLEDLNVLVVIKLSPVYLEGEHGLFRDLYDLLHHFTTFAYNEHTGQQLDRAEHNRAYCGTIAKLQRTALKHFEKKLKILALSNYSAVDRRDELEGHLAALTAGELQELCQLLGRRTSYPQSAAVSQDRALYLEILINAHEKVAHFQEVLKHTHIMPTERSLYDEALLRNETYDGSRPLAVPKLNLQYLTIGDFLWRSFILHRCESFYGIKMDIEDTVKRMQPRSAPPDQPIRFDGFSRMALPIAKPAILEVLPPKVGQLDPAQVRAEIILDVARLNPAVRQEWESLRPDDVVFLLAVRPHEQSRMILNGSSGVVDRPFKTLRAAEVIQVLDDNGRPLRESRPDQTNGFASRVRQRRLLVKLDPMAYRHDTELAAKGKPDVYDGINVIVRRRGRENNFRPILESIRRLAMSDVPSPSWLREVFLGVGDPSQANYRHMANRLTSIDYRDSFLDWQHLIDSLPGKKFKTSGTVEPGFGPPYLLQSAGANVEDPGQRTSKKRRRDQDEGPSTAEEVIRVSSYKPVNNGPYPSDAPKLNTVRFTPAQTQAIMSGTQPGLTVIVGPPGTGKTDVVTQIINNIYHNFPDQRTVLVAHSNQALNQLFQKITALDIDERHLLRLGHGEEELETETSYSKTGRVESFLENGARYLAEVDRLAANFGAPGAHGSSCETADYFNLVYVKPTWARYQEILNSEDSTVGDIITKFPFHHYFSNAPQPLFPSGAPKAQVVELIHGCYRHIEKIFAELDDIRPFEILRNARDKANYLLVKEARIIAMTSTHAAMRRQEIASLGFHYDNVVMEEAAQITEIENFIPLALQRPKNGDNPLQRIVLCGDHLQNSPVVQNLAFREYANLEQSLFSRLVRLGVPTIVLDQQGRARPSIADLYRWRYPRLLDLPFVTTSPEFITANAGLRYDYQFVNVPDYKGRGEMEPSPHFIQNLGEAEYAVALYQYMRLLGYPASKITILTTYAGQRALIRDVLTHRCKGNRLFGLPRWVGTVDKYQGEQNECTARPSAHSTGVLTKMQT